MGASREITPVDCATASARACQSAHDRSIKCGASGIGLVTGAPSDVFAGGAPLIILNVGISELGQRCARGRADPSATVSSLSCEPPAPDPVGCSCRTYTANIPYRLPTAIMIPPDRNSHSIGHLFVRDQHARPALRNGGRGPGDQHRQVLAQGQQVAPRDAAFRKSTFSRQRA